MGSDYSQGELEAGAMQFELQDIMEQGGTWALRHTFFRSVGSLGDGLQDQLGGCASRGAFED